MRVRIEGVVCPACMNKIKQELKNRFNIEVRVYFPACEFSLNPNDLECVADLVKKIHPQAQIHLSEDAHFSHKKALWILSSFLLGFLGFFDFFQFKVVYFGGFLFSPFFAFFLLAYVLSFPQVFQAALHSLKNRNFFDENTLMLTASLAGMAIGAWVEGISIIVLYSLGEHLQSFSLFKSKSLLTSLHFSLPKTASVLTQGVQKEVLLESIEVGDIVRFGPGDRVSLDVEVCAGEGHVDTRVLTGESLPEVFKVGDEIKSGSLLLDCSIEGKVLRGLQGSYFHQIQNLIQRSLEGKTPIKSFITKISQIYTPIVFFLSICVFLFPVIFGLDPYAWGYRALVVLMVSCPCALALCVPLGYSAGIGALARDGVLIKKSEVLDEIFSIDCVVFDKTGTLTRGELSLKHIFCNSKEGIQEVSSSNPEGILILQLLRGALSHSKHIIARSINKFDVRGIEVESLREFPGKGVIAHTQEGDLIIGSARFLSQEGIETADFNGSGLVVHIAKNSQYLGYIVLKDEVKKETKSILTSLLRDKKKVCIFSGDRRENVEDILKQLGVFEDGRWMASLLEVRSLMLPEDKYQGIVELKKNHRVLFVGDGINDAAAMSKSDIGMSVGDASDLTQDSADIIARRGIRGVDRFIAYAGRIRNILYQNLVMIFTIKILFLLLGIFGLASIWEAIFADVGVSLLAVLNAMRLFFVKGQSPLRGR